eukprot:CAMPEP_0205886576 /NCGR_PEP_ID=MMETSP1083-20121108/19330_1 /ASSEMBLY_ACC=CAM_ASM_000430 /TAXON_ID=97485 /ORGANISM="Prymnesium parvum, Strain Texoma1" /LENGTH=130 /DNA_ID=CAMNT_0053250263 /DNA_START=85 /DNA_END=474 /DNA_ORIENTATION=-
MVELVSVKSRILIASMSRYDSAHASSTPPVTARHHVPSSCPVCCKSSVEIFRDLALRKTNPTTTTKMTDKFNVHARMILQPLWNLLIGAEPAGLMDFALAVRSSFRSRGNWTRRELVKGFHVERAETCGG